MKWQEMYKDKYKSIEETAKIINSGDVIYFGGSCNAPYKLVDAIVDRADELENVKIIGTLMLQSSKLVTTPNLDGKINYETHFLGGYDKLGLRNGNTTVCSVNFSKEARNLQYNSKVKVLMIEGCPPDEEGYINLGPTGVSWCGEIAEYAETIIISINENQIPVHGTLYKVHVSKVHHLCEDHHSLGTLPQPEVTDIDKIIASLLVDHICDGACIQIGLGGLANAIGYGLADKKNLSVQTEMLTDSMVALAKQGVISGRIFAAFGLGSLEVYEYCGTDHVELSPISRVSEPYEVAKNDNFISINSCLMVDLTGQVCSESIGHSQFSCVGGQLDFVKGAALSKGGKSFLCMPSTLTDKNGNLQSKISLNLPAGAIVTTPRCEVMYIVTEYGIADLFCRPVEERVEAMISIAHPDFREELRSQAVAAKLLRK